MSPTIWQTDTQLRGWGDTFGLGDVDLFTADLGVFRLDQRTRRCLEGVLAAHCHGLYLAAVSGVNGIFGRDGAVSGSLYDAAVDLLIGVGPGGEPCGVCMYEPSPVMSRWDKQVPEGSWAEVRFRVVSQRLVRRGVAVRGWGLSMIVNTVTNSSMGGSGTWVLISLGGLVDVSLDTPESYAKAMG